MNKEDDMKKKLERLEAMYRRLQTSTAFTVTNVTTDRAYNANSTTLDEIADVLGTLLADLHDAGIIP